MQSPNTASANGRLLRESRSSVRARTPFLLSLRERLGPAITAAARRDGLRIGVFIVRRLIGILGHRFDFASTPPKDPEFPFSRSEPNEGEVSAALSLQQRER